MRMKLAFTLLALGTALGAQSFITSPKGYLTKEGATNHNYMIFSKSVMRWQAIDRSHQGGAPRPIFSVAWRRDGDGSTSSTYATRTLSNFEFYMANSDYNTTQVDNLDKNYKGTPVNCIKKRTLVLPDRSTKPAASPAPWDIQLKFDTPFIYSAKDAFLWEVRYDANTNTADYSCDFQYVGSSSGYKSAYGTKVGTACTATGQSSPVYFNFTFYNHGTKFRLYRYGYRYPANSPVFLNVDHKNSNLSIPGLCAPVVAMPLISFPLGNTSATGYLPSPSYVDNIPHDPYLVGATLFFQIMALDASRPAGFPVVLSAGETVKVPVSPVPTMVTRYYHYKSNPNSSTTKGGPWYGGIITRFGP